MYCTYTKQCESVYLDTKQQSITMPGHISHRKSVNLWSIFIPYLNLTACHCSIFADLHLPVRRSMRLYQTRNTKAASDVAAGRQGAVVVAAETGGNVICGRWARLILVTIIGLSRQWQRHSRKEEWLKRYTDIKMPLHWEMIADH